MDQRANHARGRRNFSIKGMIPILSLPELEAKIDAFDPIAYAKTRNYIDGSSVSNKLSIAYKTEDFLCFKWNPL